MAGEYGKIYKRVWGDGDFRALTVDEQLLYFKLCSQSDLSLAGVLTYAPVRWAMQTEGVETGDIEGSLASLAERHYVVIDHATQEVLLRSYIRNDEGWRSPRTMIGIASAIRRILSPHLKAVIATELLRVDTSNLSAKVSESSGRSTRDVVESLIGDLVDEFHDADTPSCELPDTPCDTPSDTPSDRASAVRFRSRTQLQPQLHQQRHQQQHKQQDGSARTVNKTAREELSSRADLFDDEWMTGGAA